MDELDSLDALLQAVSQNNLDKDERLYAFLCRIDKSRLKLLMERIKILDSAVAKQGVTQKKFEGRVSKLKGRAYEKIIYTLFKDTRGFASHENVLTDTNEIDILIRFSAYAALVDPFRHWGSHCICECKNYSSNVKGPWIHKLNSVLQIHNAKVGLLFSKKGLSSGNSKIKRAIQMMAGQYPNRVILCFNWEDIIACSEDTNFLSLVSRRHVELMANIDMAYLLSPD